LAEINRQLSLQGLYIGAGEISIIDATVIQAQRNRPNKDKDGNCEKPPLITSYKNCSGQIHCTTTLIQTCWVAGLIWVSSTINAHKTQKSS
jgi:hypothetical protein